MSVFSSLNVGITGVQVQSNALNTISGNIANVNTVGYKEGRTTFADLVFDNSANNYSVNGGGGINTAISFSGAKALDTSLNSVQGGISSTNSKSDLAIAGSGFFAVLPTDTSNIGELAFTRAGSFTSDAAGNYANAAGYVLQGWAFNADGTLSSSLTGADVSSAAAIAALVPVNIQNIAPTTTPTTDVSVQGNLNAAQPDYAGTPAYDPASSTKNMASGSIQPAFTIPITVVDSSGVSHTLEAAFLKGPTVLSNSGAGPFFAVSGSPDVTVTGTPPPGLVNGDTVTFNGSGAILDSNGTTMISAGTINGSYIVSNVTSSGYTITLASPAHGGIPATGNLAFVSNPSAGDTINLNGVTWTFVTGSATGNQSNIGGSLSATLTQLATDLTASTNANLAASVYTSTGTALDISHNTGDTTSNNYTLNAAVATQHLTGADGTSTAATGSLSFAVNPSAGDTINLNGTVWTFVTGTAGADQTQIQGTLSGTLTALVNDLTTAATGGDTNLNVATYAATGTALNITYGDNTLTGDNYTFTGVAASRSAPTLLGGNLTTNLFGSSTAGIAGGDGVVDQLTNNTWAVEVYANPPTDVSAANGQLTSGLVTFNSDGTLATISSSLTQALPIAWTAAGAAASNITFNWGTAGALFGTPNATVIGKSDGLEQVANSFSIKNVDQNGVAAGTSATISISSSGVISATYSNGNTHNLYQIPLAQFTDPDQLQALSDNVYKPSVDTGAFTFFSPGELGTSSIDTSSLESSNVDLAAQLTNMIIAQNAYQSNTKVLSTSDEMLQTLTSMDAPISV